MQEKVMPEKAPFPKEERNTNEAKQKNLHIEEIPAQCGKDAGSDVGEKAAVREEKISENARMSEQDKEAKQALQEARRAGPTHKKLFSASGIAKLAMLSALAFAVTFLEFPIFPAAPFLKLDFANVFVLIGGFLYGPLAAVIISGVKECLCLLKSSTGGIGELANFIVTFSFVIVPTLVYRFKKGVPVVLITLAVGCVLQLTAGLLSNRFINFPLYMGEGAEAAFETLWWYILLFNLIKGVAVSAVTILLYKRISWLFDKF